MSKFWLENYTKYVYKENIAWIDIEKKYEKIYNDHGYRTNWDYIEYILIRVQYRGGPLEELYFELSDTLVSGTDYTSNVQLFWFLYWLDAGELMKKALSAILSNKRYKKEQREKAEKEWEEKEAKKDEAKKDYEERQKNATEWEKGWGAV